MSFITRFCIALVISALVPMLFVNYSCQFALQTHLGFSNPLDPDHRPGSANQVRDGPAHLSAAMPRGARESLAGRPLANR